MLLLLLYNPLLQLLHFRTVFLHKKSNDFGVVRLLKDKYWQTANWMIWKNSFCWILPVSAWFLCRVNCGHYGYLIKARASYLYLILRLLTQSKKYRQYNQGPNLLAFLRIWNNEKISTNLYLLQQATVKSPLIIHKLALARFVNLLNSWIIYFRVE